MSHRSIAGVVNVLAGSLVVLLIAAACGGGSAVKRRPVIDGDTAVADGTGDLDGMDQGEGLDPWKDHIEVDYRTDGPFWPDFDGETVDPCLQAPYGFGCPCWENSQCESGFCVDGPEGAVCTQTCLEECPEGWLCTGMTGFGVDIVFLCVPETQKLCYPCQVDSQCSGGKCMEIGDGRYCTFNCEETRPCPNMYSCEERERNGVFIDVCIPVSGTCACMKQSAGLTRPCAYSNESGTCTGFEVCDPELGFVDCSARVPAAEECDGVDNDCNGFVDEGIPLSVACDVTVEGVGTCFGQAVCLGTLGWVCDAVTPEPEICDFKDNNCDGLIDETFRVDGKYSDLHHCGTCNQNCEGLIPNAEERCDAMRPTPMCVVDECEEGFYKLNDFQCLPDSQNICRPCSSDLVCEGGICADFGFGRHCTEACETEDDCPEYFSCDILEGHEGTWCIPVNDTCDCGAYNAGTTRPCSITNELGSCLGFETCDPTVGWLGCTAKEAIPELCDGLDNDCNGIPDDGLPVVQDCQRTNEFGTCFGQETCKGTQGWSCSAQVPSEEVCDYFDNNCDGQVDELFLVGGKYAHLHHCGSCNRSCENALPNAIAYCDVSGLLPDCRVESCLPGFFKLNEYQCILPPTVTCYPCGAHSDCFFDRCVPLDGGMFCLPVCEAGLCDVGSHCETVDGAGEVCIPDTLSCDCNQANAGKVRSCSSENEWGTCFGLETCDAMTGWGVCNARVPADETCNGVDDNCNGLIDEGFQDLGSCTITNEHGSCPGTSVCVGTLGILCQGDAPGAEVCDYRDNNCDGVVDGPFVDEDGRYVDLENCGSCNRSCVGALPNAVAFCDISVPVPVCKVESCLEGYYQLNEYQCIIPPDTTCQPCNSDADCYFDRCVQLDDGKYCLEPCSVEGSCDAGEVCVEIGGSGPYCAPVSMSCACNEANDGVVRSCDVVNEHGRCYGIQTCVPDSGWSECTAVVPAAETCDGVDSNCNGRVDEGFDSLGACSLENEWGSCLGIQICRGVDGVVCEGQLPVEEACDYVDNNCDGLVDEGFRNAQGKYTTLNHCGSCNKDCQGALPNAVAYCDGQATYPDCKVASCLDGFFQLNEYQCIEPPNMTCKPCQSDGECYFGRCVPLDGISVCLPPCLNGGCEAGSTCQVLAAWGSVCVPNSGSCDCNDANVGKVRTCSQTNEYGTCFGLQTCLPGSGWSDCDARIPAQEACDGMDNNCNGLVDEGFGNLGPCEISNVHGVCPGTYACMGAAGLVCQGAAPAAETCDYWDNNCDGQIDETFKDGNGRYFQYEHCGVCHRSCEGVVENGHAYCDASGQQAACKVESCDPGYFRLNDYQCVLPPDSTCQVCTEDSNCYFDRCVNFDQGRFCLVECQGAQDCASGLECRTVSGYTETFCVPVTGTCSCGVESQGKVRSCQRSNAFGLCRGFQTCQGGAGWSPCDALTPAPESCDGIDNDCNGLVDEGFSELGSCMNINAFGSCEGAWMCVGAGGLVCQGQMAALDVCDYQDNDCDGLVDEDFKNGQGKYVAQEHCGSCNRTCTGVLPNATAYCDVTPTVPDCKVQSCNEGFFPLNEYQCIAPPNTLCQPCTTHADCYFDRCVFLDQGNYCLPECDGGSCAAGSHCETMLGVGAVCVPDTLSCNCNPANDGVQRTCTRKNVHGTCYGIETCDSLAGWSVCSAVEPTAEQCDGVDNNCDGRVDEGFSALGPCNVTNEWGTCPGQRVCRGEEGIRCEGQAASEEMCDYIDNDCDGQVDETFKNAGGKYFTLHHCGSCNRSCQDALPNATAYCDSTPVVPNCKVESCDEGFFKLNQYQCIEPPETRCKPCFSDADCYFDRCVPFDGGQFCLTPCGIGSCEAGSHCGTVPGFGDYCVPDTLTCDCTPDAAGQVRSCVRQNSFGTCYGVQVCSPETGWSQCDARTPAGEICDGIDNNCNGQIDEGFSNLGSCELTNAWGTCVGNRVCMGQLGLICQGQDPKAEVCDYLDNNCSGLVDEEFKDAQGRYVHHDHCGSCNRSCEGSLPNAVSYCNTAVAVPECQVMECRPGYFRLNDYQCIVPPQTHCKACDSDADCYFDQCVPLDGAQYCLSLCDGVSCPAGTHCESVPGHGDICIPDTGTCNCAEANQGQVRSCSKTNAQGTCFGLQTCVAATGWTACDALTPSAEICDGIDNNCNGQIDEGFANLGACQNSNAWGTCNGLRVCMGSSGLVCQGPQASQEVCDYQDNDCDGQVDEGFRNVDGKYHTLTNCGSCGRSCVGALDNAVAFCDPKPLIPDCKVESCLPGYYPVNPYQCVIPPDTTCQSCVSDSGCYFDRCVTLDDGKYCFAECDAGSCPAGQICETVSGIAVCIPATRSCGCNPDNHGSSRTCTRTNSQGTCFGTQTCNGATGWSQCSAAVPAAETCNGIDDNCNGQVDEGFSNLGSCTVTNAFGTCSGTRVCLGAAGVVCQANTPEAETCDYLDNNCNGQVDEIFKNAQGKYHTVDHCGSCNYSCTGTIENATEYCDASAAIPKCKVQSCDPGYFKLNDYQCVLPPDTVCQACLSQADCYFNRCVALDSSTFCLEACDGTTCAAGFQCQSISGQQVCVPETGSCDCNPANHGSQRTCVRSNVQGTCYGVETCNGASGWSACSARTPAIESCNGLDDNCNGLVDEGFENLGNCTIENGFGSCVGNRVCAGAAGLVCQGNAPSAEVCDYVDNNCNSQVDETFKNAQGKYYLLNHCGSCNYSCDGTIANATEYCDASGVTPVCKVQTCDSGYFRLNDFQCVWPEDVVCKSCSSDANCYFGKCVQVDDGKYCLDRCVAGSCPAGYTCQVVSGSSVCVPNVKTCSCSTSNAGASRTCLVTNAHGTCYGTETCQPGVGWTGCTASTPAAETCDGLDNNCNGQVDEGFQNLGTCDNSNVYGSCPGSRVCMGTQGIVCQGQTPSEEVCDYLDNDCDSQVDELFKNAQGKYYMLDHCGSCNYSCEGTIANATEYCEAAGVTPVCKVQTCDTGYFRLNDFQCVLPPDVVCTSCVSDSNCYFGKCVQVDDGKYCLNQCVAGSCATGFSCQAVSGISVCVPNSGTCSCSAANSGTTRTCSVVNTHGTCYGIETCHATNGWTGCTAKTPAAETCDGLDNNCNGQVDEGFHDLGACQNTNAFGACTGTRICLGAQGIICQGQIPAAETCDYIDNDCDTQVDETFKNAQGKYNLLNHCGSCNYSCAGSIPNATEYCDASGVTPVCKVQSCDSGYFRLSDFECVLPPDVVCLGCASDANCYFGKCVQVDDGKHCLNLCSAGSCPTGFACQVVSGSSVCVPSSGTCSCSAANAGTTRTCAVANAHGTCYGVETCHATNGWTGCTAKTPAAETCDGVDNNCNGQVDEGFQNLGSCENANTFGSCTGTRLCLGAQGIVCQGQIPSEEVCDFVDNDCDGSVDETFKNAAGRYYLLDHCGGCNSSCDGTIANATEYCDASLTTPVCKVQFCDSGFFKLGDFQCVLPDDVVCDSCVTDASCFFGRCVQVDDGKYCLDLCVAGSCPTGFACQVVSGSSVCVPNSGTCSCSAANAGATRTCSRANAHGTCYGVETCHSTNGWTGCTASTPAAEICDGLDNNCNGQVDEGFQNLGTCENTNAFGTCTGTRVCLGAQGIICQGQTPAAETCDYIDNDCDTQVDETFKNAQGKYNLLNHCGSCNYSCTGTIANATEYCDASGIAPVCKVQTCDTGYYKISDFQCVWPENVVCESCTTDATCYFGKCVQVDDGKYCLNQCVAGVCPTGFTCQVLSGSSVCVPNGGTCSCSAANAGTTRTCSVVNTHGTCYGIETCHATNGWTGCTAKTPAAEICDGLDNNCNGQVDEGFQNLGACVNTNTFGSCTGTRVCLGAQGIVCQGQIPAAETCDYVDNNCDGSVDETFKNAQGKYNLLNHCGSCNYSCTGTIANATEYCDASGITPVCKVQTCDTGYYKLSDFQCVWPENVVCESCTTDATCYFGKCVQVDDGKYCLNQCVAGSCPTGFTCQVISGSSVCVPNGGTCSCSAANAGATRTCSVVNTYGTCYGIETCHATNGWTGCTASTPAAEICDGLDNNCNGQVDEGFQNLGTCENTNVFGACTGTRICLGAQGIICQGQIPAAETCDYIDNDCDTQVDETFKNAQGKYNLLNHCGSCNYSCVGSIPNATEYCDASGVTPVCKVQSCDSGYFRLSDFECVLPPDVVCLGCASDANCYFGKCVQVDDGKYCLNLCSAGSCPTGFTCQVITGASVCVPSSGTCSCSAANAGTTRTCSVANAHGACYGVETCHATNGWTGCTAKTPAAETCDGLDNNCNGQVDEGFQNLGACVNTNGYGTCTGTRVCLGAQGIVCQGQIPSEEVCDFVDNDCDGSVDETFKNAAGRYYLLDHCGGCNYSCDGTIANATEYCDASLTTPVCKVQFCDSGYFQVGGFQCVLPEDVVCDSCVTDATCYFGKCVQVDDGKYCLDLCVAGSCPTGFACQVVSGSSVCVPNSGTCSCSTANAGATRTCSRANAHGTCYGVETCHATNGWTGCTAKTPAAETCDGLDNNCNGQVDEGFQDLGACQITNAFGTCPGTQVCLGVQGIVCQGQIPASETCDYVDNNCNSQVDETFKNAQGKYDQLNHCGSCNYSCVGSIANSTAYCDASGVTPVCKVQSCDAGYYRLNDFQCIIPPDPTCQQCVSSADCYGQPCVLVDGSMRCAKTCVTNADCGGSAYSCVDVGGTKTCRPVSGSCQCHSGTVGIKRTCSNTNGFGTCFGFETCAGASGWGTCSALVPATESCDGIDNDCNGSVDDGLPASQACSVTNGYGTCTGTATCGGTAGWVCLAQTPAAETCDYVDNNCNSQVDETFKNAQGKYHLLDHCGGCNYSCTGTIPNATELCDASGTVPVCKVSSCDAGYYRLNDYQCILPPDPTCQSCASSADCYGNPCISIDGTLRCAQSCTSDLDCLDSSYTCANYGGNKVCQPISGSCQCHAGSVGITKTCSKTNGFGTCFGFQTCLGSTGWGPCNASVPAVEVCDGVDNDCDGFIDDGLPATQPCSVTNGFGTCTGVETCVGSAGWICQARTPAAEICDYIDNDCDTGVDENFKTGTKYTDFNHCGSCSVSCATGFPNATAKCDGTRETPVCVVDACSPGYFKLNDFQCIPDSASLCEPCVTDANCVLEGAKCVQLSDGKFCSKSCTGAADCPAGYSCQPYGGTNQCIPDTNSCLCSPSNVGLTKACDATWPVSPAPGEPFITCYGTQVCQVAGWSGCNLDAEICDGKDNDCNGVIDDGFLVGGKYVTDAHCGQCGNNCTFLLYANAYGYCDASLVVPSCAMQCQLGFHDVNVNPVDGCECQWLSSTDHPDGLDRNCDGIDGEVSNGIFVAKNGSDTNPGTMTQPMLTIQAGIDKALVAPVKRDVYVATGVYAQSIELKSGVRVYGGYSSDFRQRNVALNVTVIMGQTFTTAKPGAVNAISITGTAATTVLDGFTVFGRNNPTPGGSSYAVYVRNGTNALVLSNNTIEAGVGGTGAKGGDGINGNSGVNGSTGAAAFGQLVTNCSSLSPAIPRVGASGGSRTCGGTSVNGGAGGGNTCPGTYDAAPVAAENGAAGLGGAAGSGGSGGYDRQVWYCSTFPPNGECRQPASGSEFGNTGTSGGPGTTGDTVGGNACSASAGTVASGLWIPNVGASGSAGGHGSGGGGGGAGGGARNASSCTNRWHIGGTGGGGGSGGCGGTGGNGGGGGGSSFALFLVWTSAFTSGPTIAGNVVYGGVGATGGQGGNGGSGGPGGAGGLGGAANYSTAQCGAPGANGGNGGHGGHAEGGGGGCGGSSFGVFASGHGAANLAAYKTGNTFFLGSAGAGGSGGPSIGNPGDNGAAGVAAVANF